MTPAAREIPAPSVTVIIPAHNEEAIIDACLQRLQYLKDFNDVQVIVACNGSTDSTADRVRAYPWATLVEIAQASKPAALNAGDAHARYWPRVYLDADIHLDSTAILAMAFEVRPGGALACRPSYEFYLPRASCLLRRYYRARSRTSFFGKALWGAGVFALSEVGHRRLGSFPNLTADDLHVHSLFIPNEIAVLSDETVMVPVPLTLRDTLRVGRRVRRGTNESFAPTTSQSTLVELLRSSKKPTDFLDTVTYIFIALLIRLSSITYRRHRWERDESTRQPSL